MSRKFERIVDAWLITAKFYFAKKMVFPKVFARLTTGFLLTDGDENRT